MALAQLSRTRIIAEARAWLGTPYQHQASAMGAGCDCLGLVRGVWRGVIGPEPEGLPPYTPDWAERSGEELLLEAARRRLQPVALEAACPGDVILFRMAPEATMKHAAILSNNATLVHAYWGRSVLESRYSPWWKARAAAAFAFPGALPWPS
jgi:NlpC/P60 family putative phage cell wall peptidase